MGEKSYFATIKCIIYDFVDKKRRIFASVKTNGRCETSISSSFTYTNNIRKFNLIIKIERSSDLNALFLFI